MTIEELQELLKSQQETINKLQQEINEKIKEKEIEAEKEEIEKEKKLTQKLPAYAESRARFRQVMKKYGVIVPEEDVKYIFQPSFTIEVNLSKKCPKYRYKPQSSAFLGERNPGETNYKHKKEKTNKELQQELELN